MELPRFAAPEMERSPAEQRGLQVQQTDHCLHVDLRNSQLHPRIRIFLLAVVPLG